MEFVFGLLVGLAISGSVFVDELRRRRNHSHRKDL